MTSCRHPVGVAAMGDRLHAFVRRTRERAEGVEPLASDLGQVALCH